MPKLKTHRGAAKRFKKIGGSSSKRFKHSRTNKNHILTKKAQGRKRALRGLSVLAKSDEKSVGRMTGTE